MLQFELIGDTYLYMYKEKVLFVIKERKVYGVKGACYGLVNSAQFVANTLIKNGVDAKIVQVVDNNGIDREIHNYKPTICVIEALWVVPEKFIELAKLHPRVKWIIRIHSMIPFLVSEGMSFDWINKYLDLKKMHGIDISVSCNNKKLHIDLSSLYKDITYTPNIYTPDYKVKGDTHVVDKSNSVINVGAFGALRVLKNHCQQAIWAIQFANSIEKTIHFHINVSDYEKNETNPVLNNLHAIFKNSKHKLIQHAWMAHVNFIELIEQMDIGMQLSFTETFNIVAADFVGKGIPVVVSNEIEFVNKFHTVDISNPLDVLTALRHAYFDGVEHLTNKILLHRHNELAIHEWNNIIR